MVQPSGQTVHYDLQTFRVSDDLLMVEVERRHASCQMFCRFCPRTVLNAPRDLPPPDAATQARILTRFRQIVLGARTRDVYLQADDILRYPGLFDLLDFLHQEGKRVHIASPSLALADLAFAKRFVPYNLRFDITVHARDADTFTQMTGRADARDLIWQAIDNLRALGIEHQLGMVLTAINVHDAAHTLGAVATLGGYERVRLMLFYPDLVDAPAAYYDQFPTYAQVSEQFRLLRERPDVARIEIANLPPCQLDLDAVAGLHVTLTPDFNTHRAAAFEACHSCPAAPTCARVHPEYVARHPLPEPSLDHVRAVLAALEHQEAPKMVDDDCVSATEQATTAPGGVTVPVDEPPAEPMPAEGGPAEPDEPQVEPLLRVVLVDDPVIAFVVEPVQPGTHYWFSNAHLGAWFTDPPRPTPLMAKVEAVLGRVRRQLDALPADKVGLAELDKVARWARKQV